MPVKKRNYDVADAIHSAAIHLLRRLRRVDEETGLSPPKLSALSVLVFGGPRTMGQLAAAEQVRPATMTRVVQDLLQNGLVTRERAEEDARVVVLKATPKGATLLKKGRSRRVELLAEWMDQLAPQEVATLRDAARIIADLLNSANS